MAIVRAFGKPTLFITVTCNPKWPEIANALLPGQKPEDRPDLVARVFHMKLERLVKEVTKDGIFGKTSAFMRVIEFQKRGRLAVLPRQRMISFLCCTALFHKFPVLIF